MKYLSMLVMLAVMMVGIILGFFNPIEYSGKEVFYSEQEYVEFKEIVGARDVHITEMITLSSAPPIVVQYKVLIPRGMGFPYGEEDKVAPIVGYILAIIGLAGFIATLCTSFYKSKDNWDEG